VGQWFSKKYLKLNTPEIIMIQKEFRNETPPGKVIVFMLLVVSLLGGMPLSVSIGLKGFPALKMAYLRSILGIIVVGGVGLYYGMSMRMRFNELPRLSLIAALHASHIITINIGGLYTTAARSTIFFSLYPLFAVFFGHFLIPDDKLSITKTSGILKRKHRGYSLLFAVFVSLSCPI